MVAPPRGRVGPMLAPCTVRKPTSMPVCVRAGALGNHAACCGGWWGCCGGWWGAHTNGARFSSDAPSVPACQRASSSMQLFLDRPQPEPIHHPCVRAAVRRREDPQPEVENPVMPFVISPCDSPEALKTEETWWGQHEAA
jgi:hypothetical protein